MIKKIVVVISIVSILLAILVLPASAGVEGDFTGDEVRYIPFSVLYANSFIENHPFYEFGTLPYVLNNGFGLEYREGIFGSEDYRNNLAEFVIYRPWTSWNWVLNTPIRYDSSINYNSLFPSMVASNVRIVSYDDLPPDERGGYLDCRWSGTIIFGDGTSSADLDGVFFSGNFTAPISWNDNGYLTCIIGQSNYDIKGVLDYFNEAYSDRGGVWYIKDIIFQAVPQIYTSPEGAPVTGIVVPHDTNTTGGYTFVRPLSYILYDKLTSFGEERVVMQPVSSWFDWIGKALGGFFNTPLAFINDTPLTIGLLFFSIVAVFGLFFVFRAFAGG